MTEETRPGFLANYKIVRPGPLRLGPARNLKTRPGPGPARPAFGPARLTPLLVNWKLEHPCWYCITIIAKQVQSSHNCHV